MNLNKGTKVAMRGETAFKGKVVSPHPYMCNLESCRGERVSVRWEDGKLTKLCSEGLESFEDGVRLV